MKILVINGPNLNLLGIREKGIYGTEDFNALLALVHQTCERENIEVECYQSNHEGDLVDEIQSALNKNVDGIVINPGAYTHTSIALLDALKAVNLPCVEVHISKVEEREAFRQISYVRNACFKTITGYGIQGYQEAILALKERVGEAK